MAGIKKQLSYMALLTISFSMVGCETASKQGTTALFDTEVEAIKAAPSFNCKGAPKMGEKWMPCKSHKAHEKTQNHEGQHSHKH